MAWKKLPAKYKTIPKKIEKLVSETAFAKSKVYHSLKLPPNCFNIYEEFENAYNTGIANFSEMLMNAVVKEGIPNSSADRRHLMQSLNIHRESFFISAPKDSESAKVMLGEALALYADGVIDESQLSVLTKSVQAFSDLHTSVVLAEKLERLEELFEEAQKRN